MKLEVLMSCMHRQDDKLVYTSRLTGDVVVVNQCDREGYDEYETPRGRVRMFSTTQRGLTKSRNFAISKSQADICLLCDDDELFVPDYAEKITAAYEQLPQADVIIFKMVDRPTAFGDAARPLRWVDCMKVSSWQISFRREKLLSSGVKFDEFLGAGTGNGAEEELKFLLDCRKAGLAIWYVPVEIASVAQTASTWFGGFNEEFFENRGATTRYILGVPLAVLYAVYYVITKRGLYRETISPAKALQAIFRGIRQNKIWKQVKQKRGENR